MKFTVIVPYAWTDMARSEAFAFVKDWWQDQDFPVLVGLGGQPWSKGAAVDSVRDAVDTDGLIVADCDVLLTHEALSASLSAVSDGSAWAMPHGHVIRLTRNETQRIYRLGAGYVQVAHQRAGARWAPPGGGIVVLSTTAYDTVGGIDPRFVGWGGEDISFARALDTLAGVGIRFGDYLWHLWHPRTPRRPGNRACHESERLAGLYLDAEGDPDAMRALVTR